MSVYKKINTFKSDKRASTAVMFAVALPALAGFAALAVDMGLAYTTQAQLQNATDEVALAALVQIRDTRKSYNIGYTESELTDDIVAFALANVPAQAGARSIEADDIEYGVWDFNTETFSPTSSSPIGWRGVNAIRVKGHMTAARDNALSTYFGSIFRDSFDIRVSSTAVLPVPPGFHALSETASSAVYMENSDLDIADFVINSTDNQALTTDYTAGAHRGMGGYRIQVAGNARVVGPTMTGWRSVVLDQPGLRDFMEDQPQPSAGGCNYRNYLPRPHLNRIVLRPGTYCGLYILNSVDEVIFEPGQYIFNNAPLLIQNADRISAEGVNFFFSGKNANMIVRNGGRMFMRAPSTGEQRGITIMTDRDERRAPGVIAIHNMGQFTSMGQIYLPKTHLSVQHAHFNGNCVISCVVAETMRFASVLANYYGGISSLSAPGWNPSNPTGLVNPQGLETSFRPYLIEEQERTIGHVDS